MADERRKLLEVVRATVERVTRDVAIPQIREGEVVVAAPRPRVLLDGDSTPISTRLAGELPGVGQRCAVMFHRGTSFVVGAWGTPRLLALSDTVTVDQSGITTEAALAGLTVEAEIPGPNRLVGITAHVQVRTNAAGSVVGRIRGGTLGTTADPEVTVPRYGRGRVETAGAGNGILLGGMAFDVDPDVGPKLYTATLSSGITSAAEFATEPGIIAVFDLGAIPGGAT